MTDLQLFVENTCLEPQYNGFCFCTFLFGFLCLIEKNEIEKNKIGRFNIMNMCGYLNDKNPLMFLDF